MIWLVWWMHFRARRRAGVLPRYGLAVEILGVGIIALTGHLGGFNFQWAWASGFCAGHAV
jgi:hypothetical protein